MIEPGKEIIVVKFTRAWGLGNVIPGDWLEVSWLSHRHGYGLVNQHVLLTLLHISNTISYTCAAVQFPRHLGDSISGCHGDLSDRLIGGHLDKP